MTLKYQFWTVNGSTAFGVMPGGEIGSATDLEIRLQRGTPTWGWRHIDQKRRKWALEKSNRHPFPVPWVVWKKCQQPGAIWTTEEAGKIKLAMQLAPNALMVLRLHDDDIPFLTVVSIYTHDGSLDGERIGRYPGTRWAGGNPTFYLPEANPLPAKTETPVVSYKARRNLSTA